jgi:palmitoyltransferase
MKEFLLRSLNRITWIYAYLGLIYALYFIYYIVVPVYRENNQLSSINYLVFNVIFFYFFVQAYWNLILSTFISIDLRTDRKTSDRYCNQCCVYTCQRSHHCQICQTCILIHDHHCFFIGRCIGQHNQRYFLLMLFHLLSAHIIGYVFVCHYLWQEIGGVSYRSLLSIPLFNIAYFIGLIDTKWQAFICFHHYLVYFNMIFIGHLFYQINQRLWNGQTQYEAKKGLVRSVKPSFSQIFHCSNKFRLILPLFP